MMIQRSGSNSVKPNHTLPFTQRAMGGLSGSSVAGTGSVTITPRKSLYQMGESAVIKIKGPAGWAVRQRNLWQGRSTGEDASGVRGWFVVPNSDGSYVIGPDGTFTYNLHFGPRDVGEWQYEYEFATPDPSSTDQGRSEHGGLKYIPASQIQGDPLEFAVQGQQDILPRLDYTAYFADRPNTEEYYRNYVAMMEGIPASQVKIPNALRGVLRTAADSAAAVANQAVIREQNTVHMWGGDREWNKWMAASQFGTINEHAVGYPPARIAYSLQGNRSGLSPAEIAWATQGTGAIPSFFDGEIYQAQNNLIPIVSGSGGGTVAVIRPGDSAAPAGSNGASPGLQIPAIQTTSGPLSTVTQIAPSSATASVMNSAQAAIQNFESMIPSSLQQSVSVGGTSIPYWGIGLAAVAVLYMVNRK